MHSPNRAEEDQHALPGSSRPWLRIRASGAPAGQIYNRARAAQLAIPGVPTPHFRSFRSLTPSSLRVTWGAKQGRSHRIIRQAMVDPRAEGRAVTYAPPLLLCK